MSPLWRQTWWPGYRWPLVDPLAGHWHLISMVPCKITSLPGWSKGTIISYGTWSYRLYPSDSLTAGCTITFQFKMDQDNGNLPSRMKVKVNFMTATWKREWVANGQLVQVNNAFPLHAVLQYSRYHPVWPEIHGSMDYCNTNSGMLHLFWMLLTTIHTYWQGDVHTKPQLVVDFLRMHSLDLNDQLAQLYASTH